MGDQWEDTAGLGIRSLLPPSSSREPQSLAKDSSSSSNSSRTLGASVSCERIQQQQYSHSRAWMGLSPLSQ